MRLQGTVLWFNDRKGFGFIARDDGQKDVFVHHTNIDMDDFRTLSEGQHVEFIFEDRQHPNGAQAYEVRVLPE